MKYGIINVNEALQPSGGVRVQGLMWKECLIKLGHECELINFWKEYNWESFDAIIVLGYGGFIRNLSRDLKKLCKKLVLAPIIDPKWGIMQYKFFSKYWGNHKRLGLSSRFHDLYLSSKYYDVFLARSEFEATYIQKCLDVSKEKIKIVPLSIRIPIISSIPPKENFVLHVSRLASPNKNVPRLIEAAIKYKFPLKLAGFLHGEKDKQWLNNLIQGHNNIEYLGLLSETELIEWYTKAKVFALPSLTEGVGMVALEAAGRGAEIVLTDNGAPKDYYKGRAYLVNPLSIDSIGKTCLEVLNNGNKQPELLNFVRKNYSIEACSEKLFQSLAEI